MKVDFVFHGDWDTKKKEITLQKDLEIFINENLIGYYKIKTRGMKGLLSELKEYLP